MAGLGLMLISACASEQPARLGTPVYALERLFTTRPYRSTDEMLRAYRPRPAETQTTAADVGTVATARETGGSSAADASDATAAAASPAAFAEGRSPSLPAAVTIIEVNEWYPAPLGHLYGHPHPYGARPYPAHRFPRVYWPGGYGRCFGTCGGLNVSLGSSGARVRIGAGAVRSSSSTTVIARPPYLRHP
jgi:hypothetical protein